MVGSALLHAAMVNTKARSMRRSAPRLDARGWRPSFPRSAWERTSGRSASREGMNGGQRIETRTARGNVTQSVSNARSHAERGNEKSGEESGEELAAELEEELDQPRSRAKDLIG